MMAAIANSVGQLAERRKADAVEQRPGRLAEEKEERVQPDGRAARLDRDLGCKRLQRAVDHVEAAAEHDEAGELHLPGRPERNRR